LQQIPAVLPRRQAPQLPAPAPGRLESLSKAVRQPHPGVHQLEK
jgi:hypothetical protein